MSIYTTPLQFGYFMAWLFGIIFLVRGIRQERLSDRLLAFLLFILALDIQDYTFGFAGINVLWNELNGFPRGVAFLLGPALYFFILSQTNSNFKLQRKHLLHLIPWFIPFAVELSIFLQGTYAVQEFQSSDFMHYYGYIDILARYTSFGIYFYWSIKLYKKYKAWSLNNQSNADAISFQWFRNVIYMLILGYFIKEAFNVMDRFMTWDFYQDWWWNLGLVAIIIYLSISGLVQVQPSHLDFSESEGEGLPQDDNFQEPTVDQELMALAKKADGVMEESKLYLKPDLNIRELGRSLGASVNQVSAAINSYHQQNFNDYVNRYRVGEFKERLQSPTYRNFTLLALALECGFNSKSTFNRSFKKVEEISPREFADRLN
ncbi:MAG: helix-turn-helix domain-containing protein [Bacteroidota bacterium]